MIAAGGTVYSAAPVDQDLAVTGGASTTASITYSPPRSGDLNLRVDGMYLTQSTQTYTGTVPLVHNRAGFLRILVIADRTNMAAQRAGEVL